MKINEIATKRLDEAPPGVTPAVKYIGPYFDDAAKAAAKAFGVGKGTTQAELDALRAGETGAAKSGAAAADRQLSTVSKDELNALLYPPAETEPTVASWIKNRQSDAGPAVWRRRGDPGFNPDLSKNKALPPGFRDLPPADVGATIRAINNTPRPSASGPKPRPRPAEPELGNMEPPFSAGSTAADVGQIRPGAETSAPATGATTAGAPRYTMDELRQFQELYRTNPAAAEETAKKMGFLGKAGLATLATLAAGAGIQGAHMAYPDTVPSVGQLTSKAAGAVSDKIAPIGVNPNGSGPPAGDKPYDPEAFKFKPSGDNGGEKSSDDKKSSSTDDDPLRKEKDEALRKALAGEIEESASEFNRIVYLSRL